MKAHLLICLLLTLLALPAMAAQPHIMLQGRVTFQNSNHTPVQGAQVVTQQANTTTTDSEGRFYLEMVNTAPGRQTALAIDYQDQGGVVYEVVNKKDLMFLLPHEATRHQVTYYLCRQGEWEANALKYYQISIDAIEEAYTAKRDSLYAAYDDSFAQQAQLRERMKKLEEERDAVRQWAIDMSEQFAKVNLDDMNDLYREAFGHFTRGEIDSALLRLDQANLAGVLESFNLEKRHLWTLEDSLGQWEAIKDSARLNYALSAELLARLHLLYLSPSATQQILDTALASYALSLQFDSARLTGWMGYGNLLLAQQAKQLPIPNAAAHLYFEKAFAAMQQQGPQAYEDALWNAQQLLVGLQQNPQVPQQEALLYLALSGYVHVLVHLEQPHLANASRVRYQLATCLMQAQVWDPAQRHPLTQLLAGLQKAFAE